MIHYRRRIDNVDDDYPHPRIAHHTQIAHLESVITKGLAPGGVGITQDVRSQLSAYHMDESETAGEQSCWHDVRYHIVQRQED